MTRLAASLQYDVVRMTRYGLVAVSVFMVVFWGVILGLLLDGAATVAPLAVPTFLIGNTLITTFYFMAALVLFERSENTLSALIVTPLRFGEYLLSKASSLALLALLENLFVVVLLFGPDFDWLLLLIATFGVGLFYAWAGFVVILRFDSINTFLLPSTLFVVIFALPLLAHFGISGRWLFAWHPVEPFLTLMRTAYVQGSLWELTYGLVGASGWTVAAFALARHRFSKFASEEFAG